MGGYAGKLLFVDLNSGQHQIKPLDMTFARENIGGLGFGTRIFLDLINTKPMTETMPLRTGEATITRRLAKIRCI